MSKKLEDIKNKLIDHYFEVVEDDEDKETSDTIYEESQKDINIAVDVMPVRKVSNPTIISDETVIHGDIKGAQDIKIQGKVIGNINVDGNIIVEQGEVIGNIKANDVLVISSLINGNIEGNGKIDIQLNSQVEGTLHAQYILLDSESKGDVYADESMRLLSTASLIGNIETKKIFVEEGAYIKGYLKMID